MWIKYTYGIVILSFIGLVALADSGHGAELFRIASVLPGADKTAHIMLSCIVVYSMNVCLSMRCVSVFSREIFTACIIGFFFFTAEEISQIFIESRTFSLMDLLANYMGIYLCSFFSKLGCPE